MQKQYKYIFFDFDGTLVDTLEATSNAAKFALTNLGVEIDENINYGKIFSGPPLRDAFPKFNLNDNEIQEAIKLYRKYQSEKGITCNTKYVGIDNVLKNLKDEDKINVVVTGKKEEIAKRILKYENLSKYFDYIIGATEDNSRVKKDEIVNFAINCLGEIDFNKSIIVGDMPSDIKTGIKYGMDSIGVTYGPGDENILKEAGATYIASTVDELLKIII